MRIIDLWSDNSVVKLILMHLNYQREAYSFCMWLITVQSNLYDWLLGKLKITLLSRFSHTSLKIQGLSDK